MALRIVVPMEAAPGKRDELIDLFRTRSPEVRQEPGCEDYELYQSTERLDQLVLLEQWTDAHTLKVHAEVNRRIGMMEKLSSLRIGATPSERYTTQA